MQTERPAAPLRAWLGTGLIVAGLLLALFVLTLLDIDPGAVFG